MVYLYPMPSNKGRGHQMTSSEFRRAHLSRIASQLGSFASLAKKMDVSESYISQIKTGSSGIGNKTARKIERTMGLPIGYMDLPPFQSSHAPARGETVLREALSLVSDAEGHAEVLRIVADWAKNKMDASA